MQKDTISIMGCGWLGFPLAERLVADDYLVKGTTTTKDKIQLMEQSGIMPYFIINDPEPRGDNLQHFFHADVLILNIPPSIRSGRSTIEEYVTQIASIARLVQNSSISHVVFVSSTSVYANEDRIITEEDAGPAASDSGEALIQCEKLLLDNPHFTTTVLRMGGLYGPDRHPGRFLAHRKNISRPNAPVNMLHLADAVGSCIAAMQKESFGEIFNVCADEHPSRKEYYSETCKLLGLEPPEFSEIDEGGKLISNERIKNKLGYEFVYKHPLEGIV